MSKHSLWILILIAFIVFFISFYRTSGIPNERFEMIADFAISYSLYVWYRADARAEPNRATFDGIVDLGLFIFKVGFLIIPYHLIKTRKRRGWVSIFAAFFIVVIAAVAGALVGRASVPF
jgi:uncharacterized membrane protein YfcA